MKKIVLLVAVILLSLTTIAGGTWAYFSDTETTGDNDFATGTLDLGLANKEGTKPTGSTSRTWMTPVGWSPGDKLEGTLYIYNDGSIDMEQVTIAFSYRIREGTPGSVDHGPGGDTDSLEMMLIAQTVTWNGETVKELEGLPIAKLANLGQYKLGELSAHKEIALYIVWLFDPHATNGCQGDRLNMTVTVTGAQKG
ncbi:MAG: hypothetical protein JW856_04485 [Dehalococcoidales bacterium]|nr:hypothetical protein [Dehalococcoidales bacterium]